MRWLCLPACLPASRGARGRHVDALKDIAMRLRSLPSLDTRLPTLALVGAPNVGKSSLVNVLSSGTPEVGAAGRPAAALHAGTYVAVARRSQHDSGSARSSPAPPCKSRQHRSACHPIVPLYTAGSAASVLAILLLAALPRGGPVLGVRACGFAVAL